MTRFPGSHLLLLLPSLLLGADVLAANLCGPLSGTLTLAGSPYVVTCPVSVPVASTLDVDAGVEVRFQAGLGLSVAGTLNVNGTSPSPVLFTSNAAAPAAGDWSGLQISGTASLAFATVRYANESSLAGTGTFTSCTFTGNNTGLTFAPGSTGTVTGGSYSGNTSEGMHVMSSGATISGAALDGNIVAMAIELPAYPVLSGLTATGNSYRNGIYLLAGATVPLGGTFTNAGIPYVIQMTIGFDPGTTLALDAGAIVKLGPSVTLNAANVDANGTAGNPVIFTSMRDDSAGGDTNADGPSAGVANDWEAITFQGPASTLDFATVRFGDGHTVTGGATFTSCTFTGNNTGLTFAPGSTGTVTGGSYSGNTSEGMHVMSSGATISGAALDGNMVAMTIELPAYPVLSGLTATGNSYRNGIYVLAGPMVSVGGTFTNAGIPYVIGSTLGFDPGTMLALDAGAIVKLGPSVTLNATNVDANGTAGNPVIFTSVSDDAAGGDTNADGPSVGVANDWEAITFQGPASTLDFATVRFGDGHTVTGGATFTSCTFTGNNTGLTFAPGSTGTVTGGSYSGNTSEGMHVMSSGATISGAALDGNMVAMAIELPAYPVLSGLTATGNSYRNGIYVLAGPMVSVGGTFTNAGIPYVIGSTLGFDPGTTLALDAGAIVKAGPSVTLNAANMDANGTAGNPVIFTSMSDDAAGGDTNADGPSVGVANDWEAITFQGPASTLDFATVRFGDGHTVTGGATFTSCTFTGNNTGLTFAPGSTGTVTGGSYSGNTGEGMHVMSSGATISGAALDGNMVAMAIELPAYPVLSGLTATGNSYRNGIYVLAATPVLQGGTFTNAGIPYVIGSMFGFGPATTWTLLGGAVVKLGPSATVNVESIDVSGTPGDPVVFTSITDDSVAGDTNADGPSVGAPSDWVGLAASGGLVHAFVHADVRFAGTGVALSGVSALVADSRFTNSATGLRFLGGATGVVRDSVFAGNGTGVDIDAVSLPVLGNLGDADPTNDGRNSFACNLTDVTSASAVAVLAENDWWGEDPPAPGEIVGNVDVTPWLSGPARPLLRRLRAERTGFGGTDVTLTWENLSTACGYRVFRSLQPNTGFLDVSGIVSVSSFVDYGAGASAASYHYRVLVE